MGAVDADSQWMQRALELARKAEALGEVPVGAVLVRDHELIAEGWNQPIAMNDPTAHAEIMVLRKAAAKLANYRLPGTTLYVTLEPCPMCAGAMVHARIERLVFAAADPRTGAAGSVMNLLNHPDLNHAVEVQGGMLASESAEILRKFFQTRRGS